MKITNVSATWTQEQIDAAWPDVLRCLQAYVDKFPTDETLDNLVKQICNGSLALWLVEDNGENIMAVLTRGITVDPTAKRQVQLLAVGGERGDDVMPLLKDIEAWAKAKGADEMEIIGRLGWRKRLAKQGYGTVAQLYRKTLKD